MLSEENENTRAHTLQMQQIFSRESFQNGGYTPTSATKHVQWFHCVNKYIYIHVRISCFRLILLSIRLILPFPLEVSCLWCVCWFFACLVLFCCCCCFIWIFVSLMVGCFCFCPSLVPYSSIILNGLMCVMFFVCQIYRASNQLESDWNSMSASYTECSSFERCIRGRYDRKSTIFNWIIAFYRHISNKTVQIINNRTNEKQIMAKSKNILNSS